MACLLYSQTGLENSPYASLLDPIHWVDICDVFARDACGLLGLSLESPLQVCVTAGCIALPSLLQIRQVMQQQQVSGVWTSKDELPVCWFPSKLLLVQQFCWNQNCTMYRKLFNWFCSLLTLQMEVDLGPQYRYHSLFACPILREQCSDTNPPVRLSCGHVISKDALTKLTHGNKYVHAIICSTHFTPLTSQQLWIPVSYISIQPPLQTKRRLTVNSFLLSWRTNNAGGRY